jgi:hypothetical protein
MYSDILHTASTTMPSDAAKIGSALMSLAVSVALIWSLCVFENKKSLSEFITDKKDPEPEPEPEEDDQEEDQDQEVEEVETEEIPMGEPLRRMCDFGCCPYGVSLPSYYNRFTTCALRRGRRSLQSSATSRARSTLGQRMHITLPRRTLRLLPMLTITSLTPLRRSMSYTRCELWMSSSTAIRSLSCTLCSPPSTSGRAFMYAPDGLYPYQKELWEKVLMKRIYTE